MDIYGSYLLYIKHIRYIKQGPRDLLDSKACVYGYKEVNVSRVYNMHLCAGMIIIHCFCMYSTIYMYVGLYIEAN